MINFLTIQTRTMAMTANQDAYAYLIIMLQWLSFTIIGMSRKLMLGVFSMNFMQYLLPSFPKYYFIKVRKFRLIRLITTL